MQWEYYRLSADGPTIENALLELGLNGWELVAVLPESRIFYGYQCFLKRPIPESDARPVDRTTEKLSIPTLPEPRRLNNYVDG